MYSKAVNKLYFATGNKNKVKEAQAILDFPIQIADIELDEIQSLDTEKIVRKKVSDAFAILQKPVFVDDVSLSIDAWDGFPGPFIKYMTAGGANIDMLLRMLQIETNRSALLYAVIGYHDGKNIHVFNAQKKSTITTEKRGSNGWGFDPIIIPEGFEKTFAEMDEKTKNAVSHRRLALEKFKTFLQAEQKVV